MKNLTYFKATETGFIYFPLKQKILSVFCILLILFGFVFNFYYNNNALGQYAIIYRIMPIVVPLFWLYGASTKIEINIKNNHLITSHYMGLLKKNFNLDVFKGFYVLRQSSYFIYTSTQLSMVFKVNDKLNNVPVEDMRNTVKLNSLKLEITSILNNS